MFILIPRWVKFKDNKAVAVGSQHCENFDFAEVIKLPTDHYDFIGPVNVIGLTSDEIRIAVSKITG